MSETAPFISSFAPEARQDQQVGIPDPTMVTTVRDETSGLQSEMLQDNEALRSELLLEGTAEANNTLELLTHLPATSKEKIGDQEFLLSEDVVVDGRSHCVGYVKHHGKVAPRLFYRSNSEGEWRVAPTTERVTDSAGNPGWYLSKGDKFPEGYVRETRLVEDLRDALDSKSLHPSGLSTSSEWLYSKFTKEALGNRDTYDAEVRGGRMPGLPQEAFKFLPGHGFAVGQGEKPAAEQLAEIKVPQEISPDFEGPRRYSPSTHPLLGKFLKVSMPSIDGQWKWHFGKSQNGKFWPAGVTLADDKPNSYGSSEVVVLSGVFDNKPVEYASQVGGLRGQYDYEYIVPPGKHDVSTTYVDITPTMEVIPLVREFKHALAYNA